MSQSERTNENEHANVVIGSCVLFQTLSLSLSLLPTNYGGKPDFTLLFTILPS